MSITIVPVSGLGNRMRVVASAVVAAPHVEGGIRVVWQPAWDCKASFNDLFLPLGKEEGVEIERGSLLDAPATKQNLLIPLLLRKRRYDAEYRCFRPEADFQLPDFVGHRRVYMDTCYALGPYEAGDVRRLFRPVPELQERIVATTSKFAPTTIGVHIRRKDNLKAIRYSPLTAFRKRIDGLLASGEAESVFLCTDDDHVKQYFREIYGKRLITRRVNTNRNSADGIRDAVVDLYSLAATNHIIGSYYSSFSETAAELSDASFEVMRENH